MYRVTCQTASGRERTVTVSANTGNTAANRALRRVEREEPGQGWRALRVVPL